MDMNLIANPEIQSSALAMMPRASYLKHYRLKDTASSTHDVHSQLFEFQYIQRKGENWTNGKISLPELCAEQEMSAEILIVFLPAESALISVGAHKDLSKRFTIPAHFWTPLALDASGFFGSREERDDKGMIKCYNSQFRFLVKEPEEKHRTFGRDISIPDFHYFWHRPGFFTFWNPTNCVVLCFELPVFLKDFLLDPDRVSTCRLRLDDPFSFHSVLIEGVVELYNVAVWSWRNLIRKIEKNRTSEENPQPDYVLMHEVARHTIHSTEMLAMAIETAKSIIQDHEMLIMENPLVSAKAQLQKQTGKDLRYFCTLFNAFTYAFNVVAQHDSRIAVRIADATQVDSATMKTIAVLGLLFLPGSFIYSIFNTAFFSFSPGSDTEPQQWTISEKFWIYWVVAIPVTGAILFIWFVWQRWYPQNSTLKHPAQKASRQEAVMEKLE